DQIEAMTMADKIVVMHDGIVEQIGAPLDLYDRPDNTFVAGFIGSPAMNMMAGTVDAWRSKPVVALEGDVRLPLPPRTKVKKGARVIYGTRPEDITLASGNAGIAANVVVVEPTGAETLVIARAGTTEIQAAFKERHELKPGQPIRLMPMLERVHLFDAETGRRL
ncbi:MAG: TOBE domain-containing protein, partial [Rhodobiaceae bacterium]|nr:TOBE domain-containing protein [Rhodobiaceae bacterium]